VVKIKEPSLVTGAVEGGEPPGLPLTNTPVNECPAEYRPISAAKCGQTFPDGSAEEMEIKPR
jgi:hypothetical protein